MKQIYLIYNMNDIPLTYSISNISILAQDIDRRSYFYKKAYTLLQRKAEMDINYSNLLENIIYKDYVRPTNDNRPSQYLYHKIIEILLEETRRIKNFGERLKENVCKMQDLFQQENPEIKKSLMLTQSISKDFTTQREKLQKSKVKFDKKNKDLQQAKIEYMVSFLGNEQLQKKNEIYLQVNNLQQSTKPLRDDYYNISLKYNDMVEINSQKLKILLTKIETIQYRKLKMFKQIISHYLKLQKDMLDQTLRNNPFRIAKVDSVNEINQFTSHTEDIILLEKQNLMCPIVNQSLFIDCIYERMEIKKNLEQIILYGQTKLHKQQLSQIYLNELNDINEFNDKAILMINIFRNCFQGETNNQMFEQLKIILTNEEKIRKDFILCLQKYRINNQFELKIQNKDSITKCLEIFMNICNQELDTYNSKMMMVLSLTYHFTEQDRKIELQQLIRHHPIWKRVGWWQSALLESIYEQTRVKIKKEQIPITIWDIKAGGVNRKQQGQEITHQHICFNQLLYYVRNMSIFQLNPQVIIQFAKQNIFLLKLTGKFSKDILDLCPPQNGSINQFCGSA